MHDMLKEEAGNNLMRIKNYQVAAELLEIVFAITDVKETEGEK